MAKPSIVQQHAAKTSANGDEEAEHGSGNRADDPDEDGDAMRR
jgi:hypothetical protein